MGQAAAGLARHAGQPEQRSKQDQQQQQQQQQQRSKQEQEQEQQRSKQEQEQEQQQQQARAAGYYPHERKDFVDAYSTLKGLGIMAAAAGRAGRTQQAQRDRRVATDEEHGATGGPLHGPQGWSAHGCGAVDFSTLQPYTQQGAPELV